MKTLASEWGRNRRRATTAVSRKKKKLASGLCKKELQKQSPTDQTKGSLFIGLQCPGWRATMSQPLPPPPSVNQSALLSFSLFSNVSAHLVVVDPLLLSRPLVHHQQRQTLKLNTMNMLQIDKSWKSFMCLCGGGGGGGGRRRHKIETAAAAVAEKTKDKAIVGER